MATITTKTATVASSAAPSSGLRPYRIAADLYARMVASGVFGDKSPVFLWNGQLVEKISDMTKGRPHVFTLNRLARIMPGLVPVGYFVEQDQPLALGSDAVPEPDLKVVRGADAEFRTRNPAAADVPLLIEVSDSSLFDDQGEMLRGYAAASIPVYWIVNIPDRRIDVYAGPSGPSETPSYAEHRGFGPGDDVPVVLDGRAVGRIAVDDVLPERAVGEVLGLFRVVGIQFAIGSAGYDAGR